MRRMKPGRRTTVRQQRQGQRQGLVVSRGGVHQNMTFPVQPDPVSGMHCWHQKVVVTAGRSRATATATSYVDTAKSMAVFEEWMANTRPAPGPDGTRRPAWFDRPLRPTPEAYKIP
jgi:hypothetical protein